MSIGLFTPKGTKFFSLFSSMSETIRQMQQHYTRFTQQKDKDELATELARLKELKHASEATTHRVYIELGKNFITPLDREDIYALAGALNGISDYIYAIARQRINYQLYELPEVSFVMTQRLNLALDELHILVEKLSDSNHIEKLAEPCKQMKGILDSCLRLADNAKKDVLQEQTDVISVIKLLDHFDYTTILAGKCKNAGITIDNIVIKYS